jgi:tetratricopeptide (TPR) repeat protein
MIARARQWLAQKLARMRARRLWIALSFAFLALVWGGWTWLAERRYRSELMEADREMASGLHQLARQRLVTITNQRTRRDEANYRLGLCEEILGHFDTALHVLSRIPAGSSLATQSALARARLMMNTGRFAHAEVLLLPVLRTRGLETEQARNALQLLYHIEGRTGEIRELIGQSWASSGERAGLLKKLYLLDHSAFPVDRVRKSIEHADPADDRVWLAKANLAAWTGQFELASSLLDQCTEHRPNDESVWRARLELARSNGDLATFKVAAGHISLGRFTHAEVVELRAWVAARQGDLEVERSALLALTALEPGNIAGWDRLAELALMAGKKEEAEGFRRQKTAFNVVRQQYKKLLDRDDRANHAKALAQLAEKLGRRIEARGWRLIEQGSPGSDSLVLAEDLGSGVASGAKPLDFAVADLMSVAGPISPSHATGQTVSVPEYRDDAQAAGLGFVHDNGHSRRSPPPPEAMCGGVALLDYDGDGWLDVYTVQGGTFPPVESITNQGDHLFRNRRDGTFEDVTDRAGIASFAGGYGHGVTVGDFDNDGRPDLFVTRWRSYALYRNKRDGRFEDVTLQTGLGGDRDWPTSAALADLDGDGDLDLYVCHYLFYNPANPRRCTHPESPSKHECNPLDFPSLRDHVFRNDSGKFVDVTTESGFVDLDGRGLGVAAAQLDDDDKIDLYVANDMTANYLFTNRGGLRFEETGQLAGAAASADGGFKAGMGIAAGDLDGDGLIDLAVTNYFGESTTFYRNLGQGFFADHSSSINMAAPTRRLLGFGIAFVDADNDGWLDVLSANGHVLDPRPQIPWTMPLQILQGSPGGRLTDVSEQAGAPFRPLHLGRGLAAGDLDNDGRIDAVVVVQNEPLVYLHNETDDRGHFITFELEGTRSNRDGVGARITIHAGGRRQVAQRYGGGSYQSANDPRIHFGLGAATSVETVEIRWPSGQSDRHAGLRADRFYRLREGATAKE